MDSQILTHTKYPHLTLPRKKENVKKERYSFICILFSSTQCTLSILLALADARVHIHTHTGRRVLICLALPCCRLSQIQSGTPFHCRHGALVVQAEIELNIPKFPQVLDHFPPFFSEIIINHWFCLLFTVKGYYSTFWQADDPMKSNFCHFVKSFGKTVISELPL